MNNFDYLKKEPQFQSFADIAVAAENLINVDVKGDLMSRYDIYLSSQR